ncbi:valine--tRNA ligase, partial [SAR202 cluster bacterium AD-802-E10_MRT_200m]|nr:valine--tRNA ligase [SAR202 cluster bacterium AD-802-E10_MRT_200m]
MQPTFKELQPTYEPQQVEKRIYKSWLDGEFFTATIDEDKQPFVIIQPPPNVTGELHLGHAQRATIEDMLTRWHRMKGDPTLWLPGLDHAGIATQVVVERELMKEGLTRHDLGREKFLARIWEWVDTYRTRIGEQHQRLGASCDWSREKFTLDQGPSKAVRFTFVSLYKKGLIYRGERIINWCPRCETALSDLEVEHKEIEGKLYYIKYELEDQSGSITVATTRPETIPGDTALAINPDDSRYKSFIGKEVSIPTLSRNIPIITDHAVDKTFGTGALKITPGHDPTDFEIGVRHNLTVVTAINFNGTMTEAAGIYSGLDRTVCREKILNDLDKEGFLIKTEKYTHTVGHCQRCSQVVEPLVSKQWFMQMEPLAQRALRAVETGAIRIVPEHFNRVYTNWLLNIRDWCFSRQLWWGHRIPVWYCPDCDAQIVEEEEPTQCNSCGSAGIYQDPDVLDTWFSSGLWPLSTLGWPENTKDFSYFFPTTVMETGHDILFFWVARMIMLSLENVDEVPFRTIYLSGLIRDPQGIKMS